MDEKKKRISFSDNMTFSASDSSFIEKSVIFLNIKFENKKSDLTINKMLFDVFLHCEFRSYVFSLQEIIEE